MRIYALALAISLLGCSQDRQADPAPDTPEAADSYAASGWAAKTLPEIAVALDAGEVTAEALVETYLSRIERIDHAGPTLQSVLAVNPDALDDARALARSPAVKRIAPVIVAPTSTKRRAKPKSVSQTRCSRSTIRLPGLTSR